MDVIQIAQATGLSPRRLRYVLEHQVLPGAEQASKGHRITRYFTPFEAFGIALAALLLEAGLRRETVENCLTTLVATPVPARYPRGICPLMYVYDQVGASCMEIGDGVNFRLSSISGMSERKKSTIDGGWVQITTGAKVGGSYTPMVTVAIDAGRLRDLIRKQER